MIECKLADTENKFVELIWLNEPIPSGDLVKLCQKELNWKKPTTYTVLRRLCERGILKNEGTIVTSIIKKEDFLTIKTERFVEGNFNGSLPKFITAFTRNKKLSDEEIDELQRLINNHSEG